MQGFVVMRALWRIPLGSMKGFFSMWEDAVLFLLLLVRSLRMKFDLHGPIASRISGRKAARASQVMMMQRVDVRESHAWRLFSLS